MSLVSVIVPVYNVEPYIKKCVESIMNQTHSELQIILVDDGSDDKSGEICDYYALEDDRIQVYHQEHSGPSAARNNGLVHAKGQYIGFVDADDWCDPDMYRKMLTSMEEHHVDAVRCNFYIVQGEKKTKRINESVRKVISGREALTSILQHTIVPCYGSIVWNTLFRAEIITQQEALCFNSELWYGEDSDFLRRYMIRCETVLLVSDCCYYHNKNNQCSLTSHIDYRQIVDDIDRIISFLNQYQFAADDIEHQKERQKYIIICWAVQRYISNDKRFDMIKIEDVSIIKDILMKNKRSLGIIKLSIVIGMIKLRMPPIIVEKIWEMHRLS